MNAGKAHVELSALLRNKGFESQSSMLWVYCRARNNSQYHLEVPLRYHIPELTLQGIWNHNTGNDLGPYNRA